MKTLPSMSGLLPAQFKSDPASVGIGWNTINPSRNKEDSEVECITLKVNETTCEGIDNDSVNALAKDIAESSIEGTFVDDSDLIRVGDVVYVKLDHKNEYGDTLKAGGVYVVHEAGGLTLKLRDKPGSHVSLYSIKKIKDRGKVTVYGTIIASERQIEGSIMSVDLSDIPIKIITENGSIGWCYEDTIFIKEDSQ